MPTLKCMLLESIPGADYVQFDSRPIFPTDLEKKVMRALAIEQRPYSFPGYPGDDSHSGGLSPDFVMVDERDRYEQHDDDWEDLGPDEMWVGRLNEPVQVSRKAGPRIAEPGWYVVIIGSLIDPRVIAGPFQTRDDARAAVIV